MCAGVAEWCSRAFVKLRREFDSLHRHHFLGDTMFEKIKLWFEKYTESKAAAVPKYLTGKESGAELNNKRREKQTKHEDLLK
jgi:hypothetical protein